MIEEINQMKKELEELMKSHEINDVVVLKASCQLDNLILEYYSQEYNDPKSQSCCRVCGKKLNIRKNNSIKNMA